MILLQQYLKIIETTPDCVSFKSKILENKTGPNSETVALNRTPFCSEIVIMVPLSNLKLYNASIKQKFYIVNQI